ncbi:MAG: nucleoside monophosphate kinase [Cyanobacteria bacterium J06621_11]
MASKQLILLGPPGAKVEQLAIAIAELWQVAHISLKALVRQAVVKESAVGKEIRQLREKEKEIPDALLVKLLRSRFEQPDAVLKGWVLEGFPATVEQARALDELMVSFGLAEAKAAYIKASTGILINRLTSDGAGESVATLRERIIGYKERIVPVMEYYQQKVEKGAAAPSRLTVVNGSQSEAEVKNTLSRLENEETGSARFLSNETELDALIERETFVVIDCVASWCGPCKQVSPLMDKLADTYGAQASVVKLDFDNNRQVAKRFGLQGMPSVMFFEKGKLKETLTGMKPYSIYDAAMARLLK